MRDAIGAGEPGQVECRGIVDDAPILGAHVEALRQVEIAATAMDESRAGLCHTLTPLRATRRTRYRALRGPAWFR